MPSAYDTSGRLKKNALLGTSLAVDPDQAVQKGQFEELHAEAKGVAGQGREPMLGRLQGRWQEFGQQQQHRLQTIAERKGSLETQYSGLGDSKMEAGFAANKRYSQGEGYNAKSTSALAKAGMPTDFLNEARESFYKEFYHELRSAAKKKSKGGFLGKMLPSKLSKKMGKIIPSKISRVLGLPSGSKHSSEAALAKYAKNMWEARYGDPVEQQYRERISAEVDTLNQQYIPLQEEELDRQADRAELYNMFLGE
jgi:hypothetical protein